MTNLAAISLVVNQALGEMRERLALYLSTCSLPFGLGAHELLIEQPWDGLHLLLLGPLA